MTLHSAIKKIKNTKTAYLIAKIIAVRWMFINIGIVKTLSIFIDILKNSPREYPVRFKFMDNDVHLNIFSLRTDLAMITEIFCFEAYEIKEDINPKLIVDAGANKGTTSVYFGIKYPGAEIHCYEPNLDLIPTLKRHIDVNKINAKIFNEAISGKSGNKFFEKNINHQYSKIIETDNGIEVKAISLNDRYANTKVDILKLDIEGEEENVIKSMNFGKIDISIIIQEIHHDRVNYENILTTLKENKYYFSEPYPQYYYLNPEVPSPILIAIKG